MLFTEDLANQSLILVHPIVRDIVEKTSKVESLFKKEKISKTEGSLVKALKRDIQYHIKELETIGCILRDRESGEVAFPIHEFKLSSYFSWTLDEPSVSLVIRGENSVVHIRPYIEEKQK